MFGFDHDHHAEWLEAFEKCICDVCSQSFLKLQSPRECFRKTRQLRDAENASALRDVRDVTATNKRREVMLAQRCDADVFYDHHLVVLVTRQRDDVLRRIFAHAGS